MADAAAGRPSSRPHPTVAQHRIVFTPSGLDASVESGTTVLDAARRLGVDLDSVCGGRADQFFTNRGWTQAMAEPAPWASTRT